VDLGESLRNAQDDLDPDALRSLGDQRRKLVAQVAGQAAALAENRDQKVGPSIRDEVEQTLQAALADAAAADAVRTGRLARALATNGFDAVDLDGAVAGGAAAVARPGREKKAHGSAGRDEIAEARRRKEELEGRRRELDEASAELEAARERARRSATARQQTETEHDGLRSERDELRARLEELEIRLTQSVSQLRSSSADADDAEDALASAEDAETRARSRYEALRKRSH
jgi:hypothetical protein